MKRLFHLLALSLTLTFGLTACISADPARVANAVNATLTAVITPTPIVVVVTVAGGGLAPIPTVTQEVGAQQTLAAATETLAAASATAPPDASPTTSRTQARPPTATPQPSAARLPIGTPTFIGKAIFTDDFSQPQVWPASDDNAQRIAVADGQLSITLKAEDRFTIVYDVKRRAADFYAAVTGTAAACRFRDRHGLLFRLQDSSNYYQFEVDCDGRYRLAKVLDGALTPLKDWTASEAIRKGEGMTNELGVRAKGGTLEVFVNGQALFQAQDSAYAEGGFGLYTGSGLSGTYTAVFDDLAVSSLQNSP